MREIKFRVWDVINKRILNYGEIMHLPMWEVFSGTPEQRAFNVMQYTGLKDKNSKMIWEGDILKRNNNNKDLVQVKFGEFLVYELETEEVIDKACGWYCEVVTTDELSKLAPFCYPTPLNKYWIDKLDIKIVGNIYEDKHLLEG